MKAWRPGSGRKASKFAISVWNKFRVADITGLAAEISYYFVLAIFPFLIIVAALVSTLPFTVVWTTVLQWITLYFPRESQSMVFRTVLGLTAGRTGFLSLGIVGTIWSASSGLMSLMDSLNKIYEVREGRGYFHRLGIAVGMVFVLALLLISTFGLMAAEGRIDQWLAGHLMGFIAEPSLWRVTWWLTSVVVFSLDIAILDRMMPNLHRPRPRIIPGVLFTLLGWLISTSGFNLYARHLATFNRTYGIMGVFVLLMVWIYLLSIVFLTGAAINSELTKVQKRAA